MIKADKKKENISRKIKGRGVTERNIKKKRRVKIINRGKEESGWMLKE